MRIKKSIIMILLFTVIISGIFGSLIAEDKVSRGAMLSNSCFGCHGTNGKSEGSIPAIHKKSAQAIHTALMEFKTGTKPSTVMNRHAKGYSDDDLKLIADYIAGLKK